MEFLIWVVCVLALLIGLVGVGILLNKQPYTWKEHQKEFSKQLTDALLEVNKKNMEK